MKRALVFLLLGPVLGVLIAFYLVGQGYRDLYVAPIVFFFSLIVCAIAGLVDGLLACVIPIWLRAPLTAVAGTAIAVGLYVFLLGIRPLDKLLLIAEFGASSTAACSLLSHPFHRRKA